jgi:predicted anti-sigma-YlaC factor YlaD
MSACDELLARLEGDPTGTVPASLAEHVGGCRDCQRAVERLAAVASTGAALHGLSAPAALKARLLALPRLALGCERAVDLVSAALDNTITTDDRSWLIEHMHGCPACHATWESLATLHEVGTVCSVTARQRAALSLPPRQRIAARRPRRLIDLRLATAAVYIIAAVTVFLVSDPATVARASNVQMDRAATYASAAVENRVSSYTRQLRKGLTTVAAWAGDRGRDVLALFHRPTPANQSSPEHVKPVGGRQ